MHKPHLHIPGPKHLFRMFIQAGKHWIDDFAPSMGAAISYYTVFSLAPLLVIVIAMAGAIFGRDAVQGQIVQQVGGLVGEQGAQLIQTILAAASDTDKGLVAGIISFFVLIIGATTVFGELQSALDRIWHVPEAQKPSGIWAMLRTRLLSFGMILGLVFLLMVSLAVSAAVAAFNSWSGGLFPGFEILVQIVNLAFSLGIATLLFAMIYKLMPSTKIEWRDVWVGAFTTAVLFNIGKTLIGLYLGKSSMTESFAAAGSLVVLLAWVYYAAQIFLLGAEFTKVYADEHGSTAATKAVHATQATAVLGGHVEATPTGPVPASAVVAKVKLVETPESKARQEPDHDPALDSPAFKATDAGLRAALTGLAAELVALVVVTAAGSLLHRKRMTLQREYGWSKTPKEKQREKAQKKALERAREQQRPKARSRWPLLAR